MDNPQKSCTHCWRHYPEEQGGHNTPNGWICLKCEKEMMSVLKVELNPPHFIRPTDLATLERIIQCMGHGQEVRMTTDCMPVLEFFSRPSPTIIVSQL